MAPPPAPPVVAAKLRRPELRPQIVPRPGLERLLTPTTTPRVTLVDAPAGFGKTTLVAQWAARVDDADVAWVSLDRADDDPARLWTYVVAALESRLGADAERARTAIQGGAGIVEGALPWVIEGLTRGEVHLVLDDYHLISNADVHDQVAYLAERLPAGAHLVLLTRADPALPLSRMRASGQLHEIRADRLRFSRAEAQRLLNGSHGLGLSDEEVDRLVERTEGWVTGLALAILSLADRDDKREFVERFAGTQAHLVEYLVSEVLARQSDEARDFMLGTSVLDRCCGPLCDAVLERRGSAGLLRDLERANVFLLPIDGEHSWYRFHQLFLDVLRNELLLTAPERITGLHRRASEWYRESGMVGEAIDHALLGGAYDVASDLIATSFLSELAAGRVATLGRWLAALPAELVERDARLGLAAASHASILGGPSEVERWLEKAESGSSRPPLPEGLPSVEAGIAVVRGTYSGCDVGRQLAAARRGVELCAEGSPWHPYAVCALGYALYWAGESDEARSVLAEAQELVEAALSTSAVLAYRALIALDGGDWPVGDRLSRDAAAAVERHDLERVPRTGIVRFARGRALAARGLAPAAIGELDAGVSLARRGPYPLELLYGLLTLAELELSSGLAERGEDRLREAERLLSTCTDPGILAAALERLRHHGEAAPPAASSNGELSPRELEVLRLLPSELSEAQLAERLFVSRNTVHSHVRAIFRKLAVSSRAEAVDRAQALGLLDREAR